MASIKRVGKDKFGVPVWEVIYRRTPGGKQIRRRIHAESKADAERAVLLDSNRSGISLKWSEGLKLYVDAKHQEGRNPEAIAHAERAVSVFSQVIGDIPIEKTDPDTLKHFLSLVSGGVTVKDIHGREYKTAGAGVANHHRKELITVARYWAAAGLEKKKIHEVRHTLGTIAGKHFSLGMVQAAMGHRSRQSSETYFHPNEEMAAKVREKVITELSQNCDKASQNESSPVTLVIDEDKESGEYLCPCCSRKLLIVKKKERKP